MDNSKPKVRRTFYTVVVKRLFDIVLSGFAIIVLSPLLLIISILVLVIHGRPVLFQQERIGLHNIVFNIFKFRSMTNEKDDNGHLLPEEKRLTGFGKMLRRLSLDELPELFCIFAGKMSIIGPRPLLVKYLPLYTERHLARHEMRPGLACVPLQHTETWSWNDQFENDIWYIENCSFLIDVKMVFAVIKEVFAGAEYRAAGDRAEFTGDNLYTDARER